ncbi:DUF4468 domain-containing protein [Siphonobacter sp. SORGH_AS_0500]|uniref:DUF4468 domain-containing protein n=1 Tax=Siphonobacter sp. SORGH_AS_0500 TaxID=1864824 RepID=UPI00285619CC|nr:DUF4468 domain-containing protein [Siphonobacter sp. SORGH_AS_0500]MDR6195208.1 hypothetical protein [Siphonobacter sp. SORGH_AS_0500]
MKKVLLTSFILLSLVTIVKAQDLPVDKESGKITYSEVVDVPGSSKVELYGRALTWFAQSFKSSKSVLQVEDKDNGKIIGKGNIPIIIKVPIMGNTDAGWVNAMFTIVSKDGKYKYTIDNFYHERPLGKNTENWTDGGSLEQEKPKVGMMGRPSKKEWNSIKESLDKDMQSTIASLKKAMSKSDTDF